MLLGGYGGYRIYLKALSISYHGISALPGSHDNDSEHVKQSSSIEIRKDTMHV